MNTVRRSMSFPEDVYEAMRLEAFSRRMSVNQLVVEKVKPTIFPPTSGLRGKPRRSYIQKPSFAVANSSLLTIKKNAYEALFQMRGSVKGKPDMSVTVDEIYDSEND